MVTVLCWKKPIPCSVLTCSPGYVRYMPCNNCCQQESVSKMSLKVNWLSLIFHYRVITNHSSFPCLPHPDASLVPNIAGMKCKWPQEVLQTSSLGSISCYFQYTLSHLVQVNTEQLLTVSKQFSYNYWPSCSNQNIGLNL